ncbi:DHA2 family efflux MFS transporter permease subunit [Blastochloris viridis]|uniref:Inner membrane component of tripartite multidrug resistance system n=1 Tax=Blastochloris viridis TaxID=1079 RepID=A0A0H5BCH9_BLAVI|nr:DHA2 family efflux MFS transporter permease subunit [Blastochloris viridis]ALK07902.1 Multidrug export protein EmrB [Blastochloris viridis]BAR98849.1 inner membrane component of tripartite multidrug resistance system [Blastochloris viridis]CUU43824.1 Multidrug resistance protein B [Blastochloris viridis]
MTDATLTGATAVPAGAPADERIDPMRVVAFAAMIFGMFMAILDIQIVSASLAEIQAGLSASADEISWVQTAYLIAEVVMIPLSGFLSRALSTRVLFAGCAAGFTLASALCATATSIEEMIVFRAIQGFIGGGMIPSVFAASFTLFRGKQRAVVTPLIGLIATLAPTIGPTIGGYLTQAFSWHWLFLINVGPGIAVTLAAVLLIDFDKPDHSLLKHLDWLGLFGMAAFLGSLEYVLEEGPNHDWLQDEAVFNCTVVLVVGAVVFAWRAFTAHEPIVDIYAYRDRNFAFGSLLSGVLGIGLYGLTYLYPVYLARVRGYDSLMIGETVFVSGVAMFLTAPISGKLSTKIDPRLLMMIGFAAVGLSTFMVTDVTKDWDFWEIFVPQILRGSGLMLCMVPITNLALGTLPQEELKNASGLFNLARNLGGAIGLAAINTVLNDRMDLHLARLHEHVAWGRGAAEELLANLTLKFSHFGPGTDEMAAIKQMALLVRREALVMAFADVFFVLTVLFGLVACAAMALHKPKPMDGGGGGH